MLTIRIRRLWVLSAVVVRAVIGHHGRPGSLLPPSAALPSAMRGISSGCGRLEGRSAQPDNGSTVIYAMTAEGARTPVWPGRRDYLHR